MSQVIWNTIVPSTTSGNQLATLLNSFKDAVVSGFSGTSRPSQLQAQGYWVDTTNDPTSWTVKVYTGVVDIPVYTVDLVNGIVSVPSAVSSFQIFKSSDDAIGPVLSLIKERATGLGQTLVSDDIGSIRFTGTQDDGIQAVQARIRAISKNNVTVSAAGSDLIFEGITVGAAVLTEWMRLQGGKLGVGTNTPDEVIHAFGNIKAEKSSNDAVAAKIITKKRRTAGTGQVLANDEIFNLSINSYTSSSAEVETALIKAIALENHTTAAQGTKILIQRKKSTTNTMVTAITIDDTTVTIADNLVVSGTSTFSGTIVVDSSFQIKDDSDATKILQFQVSTITTGTTRTLTVPNANTTLVGTDVGQTLTTKIYAESQATDSTTTGANASLAAITSGVFRLTNASLTSLANIPAGTVSQGITLHNRTGATIHIIDSSAASGTAANRILTGTGGTIAVANNASIFLKYDSTTARWQVIGGSGSGGGGGSALLWKRSTGTAPVVEQVDGFEFNSFDNVSNQEVYATFIVPSTYTPGNPISLKSGKFFCVSTSGNVLFTATTHLVSVLGTYGTPNTSANTQVAVSGVSNTKNSIGTIDLTSSSGQINAVSVAAGDILRIKLSRNNTSETSGAAGDARLLLDSFELTMS